MKIGYNNYVRVKNLNLAPLTWNLIKTSLYQSSFCCFSLKAVYNFSSSPLIPTFSSNLLLTFYQQNHLKSIQPFSVVIKAVKGEKNIERALGFKLR